MKSAAATWFLITTLVLPLTLMAVEPSPPENRILRVGWSDMEPFQYMEGEDRLAHLTGMDIELLREALSRIGCVPRFVQLDWSEQLEQLQAGTLDVVLAAARYPDRDKYAWFSTPFRHSEQVIVLPANSQLARLASTPSALLRLLQLERCSVAVVKGRRSSELLEELLGQRRDLILYTGSEAECFQALARGRVDGMMADRLSVATVSARHSWRGRPITVTDTDIAGDVGAMFCRQTVDSALVARFNAALAEMSQDGSRARILRQFDWAGVLSSLATVTTGKLFALLDLLGTVAFSLSGIMLARKERFSLLGAMVLAMLPAVGGGILRDIILGRRPPGLVEDPFSLIVVVLTVIAGHLLLRLFSFLRRHYSRLVVLGDFPAKRRRLRLVGEIYQFSDAIGLAAFTVVGVASTIEMRITPLWLWGPLSAALTAAGGGVLRDLFRSDSDSPNLKRAFYAEVPLLWGVLLSLFIHLQQGGGQVRSVNLAIWFTLVGALATRLAAMHLGFTLPFGERRRKKSGNFA